MIMIFGSLWQMPQEQLHLQSSQNHYLQFQRIYFIFCVQILYQFRRFVELMKQKVMKFTT